MKYISTRGKTEAIAFTDAVMMGLASDKGLIIPEQIPQVQDKIGAWKTIKKKYN